MDLFDGPEVTALSREGMPGELPAFKGPADRTLPTLTATRPRHTDDCWTPPPTATSDGAQTRTILRVTRTQPAATQHGLGWIVDPAKGIPRVRGRLGLRHGPAGLWDPRSHPVGRTPRSHPMDGYFAAPTKAPPTLVEDGRLRPRPAQCPIPRFPLPVGTLLLLSTPSVGIPPALGLGDKGHGAVGERVGLHQPPPDGADHVWTRYLPSPTANSGARLPRQSKGPRRHPTHPDNPISAVRVQSASVTG